MFLNFLIAIISQVYEQDLVMSLSNNYTQKCEMNLEVDFLLRFFYFRRLDDLFILTGSIKDSIEDDTEEWQGFIQKMRIYQKQETALIKEEMAKNVDSIKDEIKSNKNDMNSNKFDLSDSLISTNIDELPSYLQKNLEKYREWID